MTPKEKRLILAEYRKTKEEHSKVFDSIISEFRKEIQKLKSA